MFEEWFDEAAWDRIYVAQTGDTHYAEARNNCWSFGLPEGQTTSRAEIVTFLRAMAKAREEQLRVRFNSDHPMTFYAWVDEQAGQLRFSLETATPDALCFGCKLQLVNTPEEIADEFLKSPYLHGIPFGDLVPVSYISSHTPEASRELPPLSIWAIHLAEKPAISEK